MNFFKYYLLALQPFWRNMSNSQAFECEIIF